MIKKKWALNFISLSFKAVLKLTISALVIIFILFLLLFSRKASKTVVSFYLSLRHFYLII